MDTKTYNKIKGFCTRFLVQFHHNRHLEDLIQSVAMQDFKSEGKKSWQWACCDYCRDNGLNRNGRSKVGARTLEISLSIDAPGKNEDSENSMYLLNQESISRSDNDSRLTNQDDNFKGALEEFLSPLSLNNKVMKWALKSYKVKTSLK